MNPSPFSRLRRILPWILVLSLLTFPSPVSAETKDRHILLVGRDGTQTQTSRSDTMILCTLREGENTLILTSVLRDLYVRIPGHGYDRINAACAYGGTKLLKQTMEENFSISIDGVVQIDFSGFPRLIDRLGGVKLTLRPDEAALISRETGSSLQSGEQTLTGAQALVYARIRKLDADGDFSRTHRQRKLLSSLLETYRDAGLVTVLRTMDAILPLISTDMETAALMQLVSRYYSAFSSLKVVSRHVPEDGKYRFETKNGMSVIVTEQSYLRQAFVFSDS